MTADSSRHGYPLWLTIVIALMGGFAFLVGVVGLVAGLSGEGDDSRNFSLAMLLVGVALLGGLWLTSRLPYVSVGLVVLGALGFGMSTFWMVFTVVVGVAVAIAALACAPRVIGARPAT